MWDTGAPSPSFQEEDFSKAFAAPAIYALAY